MKYIIALFLSANLAGCAVVKVCDTHPVACSTVAAVGVSVAVAAVESKRLHQQLEQQAAQFENR